MSKYAVRRLGLNPCTKKEYGQFKGKSSKKINAIKKVSEEAVNKLIAKASIKSESKKEN